MHTDNDIIAFLIRNATADKYLPVDLSERNGFDDGVLPQVLLRLSGVTRYTVPLPLFVEFMGGEPYSFEKHLRSVHDSGALQFRVAKAGDFYDSPEYRKASDHVRGLVSGSEPGHPCCIAFTVGKEDATQVAVGMYFEVLANLEALGVKIPKRRGKKTWEGVFP